MYESAASGAAATTPTAGGYTVGPVATITAKGARNVALRDSAVAAAATGSGGTAVTTGTAGGLARACRRRRFDHRCRTHLPGCPRCWPRGRAWD